MSQVFIISAPSGSGKSTLVARLLAADPALLFSVSYTSRPPRGAEVNGQQYHFVSRPDFERMLANGEFLESAQVFGNYYGTHQSILDRGMREGRDVVLDIDVQGARQLSERIPQAVRIFILAPSKAELEKRLRARSEDSEEVIARRLAAALGEIQDFGRYDYILVNDDVDRASELLLAIVKSARARRTNPEVERRVREIEATFESPAQTAGKS